MLLLPPPLIDCVHHMDCFDLLRLIPAGSIDAIITDLPYQTTALIWDQIIPFAPMWAEVKRVLKPRGVFVTTASQPFTSALVMSNPSWFKYCWVWVKNRGTNFANAKKQPIRAYEDVLVFGGDSYYPQGLIRIDRLMRNSRSVGGGVLRGVKDLSGGGVLRSSQGCYIQEYENYPTNVLRFGSTEALHPTQKPLSLFEYLIKTYTQPGELVLDFCAGSGTTPLACRNTGRRFIAGDSDAHYCAIARDRLRLPFEPREVAKESAPLSDLPLFATLAVGD